MPEAGVLSERMRRCCQGGIGPAAAVRRSAGRRALRARDRAICASARTRARATRRLCRRRGMADRAAGVAGHRPSASPRPHLCIRVPCSRTRPPRRCTVFHRSDRASDRVHVITAEGRPGAASGVIRHRGVVADEDVVETDGLTCTTLLRTVSDVARTAAFEQSVTITDAALRSLCVPKPGTYLSDRAQAWRDEALEIARESAHGLSRARRALGFADGRAQLPGESVSRVRLWELGFQDPDLQVTVPGPHGSKYYVDFGFHDSVPSGSSTMKYVDGRLTDGRTSSEVFDREKQREDWIRGRTQYRFSRWGWPHIETATILGTRLLAFGVRPPQ